MPTALFVIAPGNFRDEELFHAKEELEKAGIKTGIASTKKGEYFGRFGGKAVAGFAASEIRASDYDIIIFVGGPGVMQNRLHENRDFLRLAQDASDCTKVLAAICMGPKILAGAGVLRGKRLTTFPDAEAIEMIRKNGGIYTGMGVEECERGNGRKLITANGPENSREFAKMIIDALKKRN